MKVIIIEDEQLSAEHLANLLKKADSNIEVTAVFDSVRRTVEAINKGAAPDLLFVDIHLADGLSFEIFDKVEVDAPVIFTTAYDEYAIKAFKYNSIDYLLKPVGLAELKTAIEKYKRINEASTKVSVKEIKNVYEALSKNYKQRFMVKMGESIVSVRAEEINHFMAEDGIVLLCASNGKRYAVDYTLDQVEEYCDPKFFFRINRKVVVNITSIQKISTYFNGRLKIVSHSLSEDESIVSRERVNEFKQWLDK